MIYQTVLVLALAIVAVHSSPIAFQSKFLPTCATGSYICSKATGERLPSFFPRCIKFEQLCDGKEDCGNGDDESNELCADKEKLKELQQQIEQNQNQPKPDGVENDFSGTGFMFSVQNLVIEGGSNVKMFNQNSDNFEQTNEAQKKKEGDEEKKDDNSN